jgi:hypothetical protein
LIFWMRRGIAQKHARLLSCVLFGSFLEGNDV